MNYEVFKDKVNALIERAGGGIDVGFRHEDGKHIAKCSDGTVIVGNSVSLQVAVNWNGKAHTAMAVI